MALADTILDLRNQRDAIERALDALEEVSQANVAARPGAYRAPQQTTTNQPKKRNISPELAASRSQRMKEAWERRRAKERETAQPAVAIQAQPSLEEQLANAAKAAEHAPPAVPEEIPVVQTETAQATPPARTKRAGGRAN